MAVDTSVARSRAIKQPVSRLAISSIKLSNLLSFDPETPALELRPLNILIGANGSGKSNFLDAISLLQAAGQKKLEERIVRQGGGVSNWLWQGADKAAKATIDVVLPYAGYLDYGGTGLRYWLCFKEGEKQELVVSNERLENSTVTGGDKAWRYLNYLDGRAMLNPLFTPPLASEDEEQAEHRRQYQPPAQTSRQMTEHKRASVQESMLAENWSLHSYPETAYVSNLFRSFRLYRDWSFGRTAPVRNLQPIGLQANETLLDEDSSNLAAVINNLSGDRSFRKRLLKYLKEFMAGASDVTAKPIGGQFLQLLLKEGDYSIPANRLSDGTLRWLSLLVILLHQPTMSVPPTLICLDEPETGLHPDLIPALAELLKEAAQHIQIIVTTHSRQLVDKFTDSPEDVVVCEREEGYTTMRRLQATELTGWLDDYSLGQAWTRNAFGGNRF